MNTVEAEDWFKQEIKPAFEEVEKSIKDGHQLRYVIQSILKLILACNFIVKGE